MKQLLVIKTNFVKKNSLSNELFTTVSGNKIVMSTIVLAKTCFYGQVSVGILDFLYVGRTKALNLVEPLIIVTRTWSFYFVT